jgi:ATPase subunit of ABC transporter with duplicated ATPase domains
MSSSMSTSVVAADLRFRWPDGTVVFDRLDFAVGPGRTGLVGVNGSGKSTLLRLIAGELTPTAGTVSSAGHIGYLPQHLPLDTGRIVDDVLGIAATRRAIAAIEAGDVATEHFTAVGDDWDIEKRAQATLARLGLEHITLDRSVGELSGGEAMLLGMAGQLLRRPDVLLLDEPTNNLDLDARHRLYDVVESWPGVLIVACHDRALLERVDQIAELSEGSLSWYGGNFTDYEQALGRAQEAAQRAVRTAEADLRRQRRDLAEARIKLERRQRYGRTAFAQKREPKIIMGMRKRQAQVSAGKHRIMHEDKAAQAHDRLSDAQEAVRDDAEIRIDLPETEVPAGRTVLRTEGVRVLGVPVDLMIRGPERIALLGANGAGKSSLLRLIAGEPTQTSGPVTGPVTGPDNDTDSDTDNDTENDPVSGPITGTVHVGVAGVRHLPQRLDLLDGDLSVVENVRRFAPAASVNEIRARLARFQFRGARADQLAGTLSGGERLRAVLATLLSAQPPPQLLLLDEPTNNLDLAAVQQLETALRTYRGALVVAGHDLPFLSEIGITRWLRLEPAGLIEIDPPESPL